MKEHGAVYFGAIGGAGALLSRCIKKAEIIAYEDLGAEALRRLEVEDLPAFVIIDSEGNNLYETEEKSISNRSGKIIREYFQKSTRGARKMEKKETGYRRYRRRCSRGGQRDSQPCVSGCGI